MNTGKTYMMLKKIFLLAGTSLHLSFSSALFMAVGCLMLPLGLAIGEEVAVETAESSYTLMKITDMDKTVTFSVLTQADLKALTESVNADERAIDRAYNNLVNKWKAKHTPKTPDRTGKRPKIPAYPLKRPEPKKIAFVARFPTEAEALAKKKSCEEKEAARLLEVKAREEKAEAERQSRMSSSSSASSKPNAPMANSKAADEIDPDLQKELFAELKKEIDAIVAGDTGNSPNGSKNAEGKGTVKQVKRMGEGMNTSLDFHPAPDAKTTKVTK
jgi:hypothetical protein